MDTDTLLATYHEVVKTLLLAIHQSQIELRAFADGEPASDGTDWAIYENGKAIAFARTELHLEPNEEFGRDYIAP